DAEVRCEAIPCPQPGGPPPVPDGTFGSAMTAAKGRFGIDLRWDESICPAPSHHLVYGSLASVRTMAVEGTECGLWGGRHTWYPVPAGNLWFLVVAASGEGIEGSWGTDSAGRFRGGAATSGGCGITVRNNYPDCP